MDALWRRGRWSRRRWGNEVHEFRPQWDNFGMKYRNDNDGRRNGGLKSERGECRPAALRADKMGGFQKRFLKHDGTSKWIDVPHPGEECGCWVRHRWHSEGSETQRIAAAIRAAAAGMTHLRRAFCA
jgi:hypothetical protein